VPPKRARRKRGQANYPHDAVFEVLRGWRRARAGEHGVPPYVIFHDSTLREVAVRRPASLTELSKIEGIGDTKLARHGESLLSALARAKEAEDASEA
jgi:ATP-dependent DNA helicase RecQ